jgi:hypothetical protein
MVFITANGSSNNTVRTSRPICPTTRTSPLSAPEQVCSRFATSRKQ